MTATDNFARTLQQFTLQNVRVVTEAGHDKLLGGGSSTSVLEIEYKGLKCAGKKIHEWLLEDQASDAIRRFVEECDFLSQVRHPNIVQFLGIYFQQGVRTPILVMEFLPTNLTSCIKQYDILPKDISYSILHDVALGLCYLHSQTPTIIHRNLNSSNVLLTSNMRAKISDLGKAKILLNFQAASGMTKNPGTHACFMPPEAMIAEPKYDTCIDEFSYGILMIHVFSGKWPDPQVGQNRTESDGTIIPVSEAERRTVFLRSIGNDHPLMDLILKCINNHPPARAHASEIVERLAEMVLQFPASFANRLEMLRRIEAVEGNNRSMAKEIDLLKIELSSEVKELQSQITALNEQNQRLKEEQVVKDRQKEQALFGLDQFESDQIRLNIPSEGTILKEGSPLITPVVTKRHIDNYHPGKRIQRCQLSADSEFKSISAEAKPIPALEHHVKLIGAKEPHNMFAIKPPASDSAIDRHQQTTYSASRERERMVVSTSADSQGDSCQQTYSASDESEKPTLKNVLKALLNKAAKSWEDIGILLGIDDGQLNRIKADNAGDCNACLREMSRIWLKHVNPPPSWSEMADALETLGNEDIASQIRDNYQCST